MGPFGTIGSSTGGRASWAALLLPAGFSSSLPRVRGHEVFFRKGKVGDWVNHLTQDMVRKIDCVVEQKFKGIWACLISRNVYTRT
ncbi:hypothetical protein BS78_K033000 [Paspalum vaginatum]|uniref:Sulfotransferase n=1 Tax=Paspalum vaginatum TaxID=158149 RepID=A0A9W8CDB9_9POAL|nr:hypothetical protein BS78_K033000 [Paspalum vaginatum]